MSNRLFSGLNGGERPGRGKVSPDLSNAVAAAKDLLGWHLVHESPEGRTEGIIVETEAYQEDDPASHTFKGPSKRNAAMFGAAGHAYIYFTYGMHYCFNVVTGAEGQGQGVLIRALEPVDGIALMSSRRKKTDIRQLTNGPAKLVAAMGITKKHYGHYLLDGRELYLKPGGLPGKIAAAPRIGINRAVDVRWRFYIEANPFVSVHKNV